MSRRTVCLVLTAGAGAEPTVTALRLAERLLARGCRVTVFAHGPATLLAAGHDDLARAIAGLLRRGVHGATLDWVADAGSAEAAAAAGAQAAGVVLGDHADLWAFVRDADLVLSPGGGCPWPAAS